MSLEELQPPMKPSAAALLALLTAMFYASCSKPDPEAARAAALSEARASIRKCLPAAEPGPESGPRIAVHSLSTGRDETVVRIVAYAGPAAAADFDLPAYSLSRGRWLIDGRYRAYLLDEYCREYKLKDRRPSVGSAIPVDGRVKLAPGQAFEASLVFPSLYEKSRVAVLIYGGRISEMMLRPDGDWPERK